MSKIIGKMSAGIGYTVQSVKNASSNCKVDGRVCGKEKEIHDYTVEIGRLTVKSLDEKKNLGPEIMERYEAICAAREAIKEAEKDRIAAKVVCPKCGEKTSAEMHYCSHCGAALCAEQASEEETA